MVSSVEFPLSSESCRGGLDGDRSITVANHDDTLTRGVSRASGLLEEQAMAPGEGESVHFRAHNIRDRSARCDRGSAGELH
jgi:hypothetical protein